MDNEVVGGQIVGAVVNVVVGSVECATVGDDVNTVVCAILEAVVREDIGAVVMVEQLMK